MVKNVVITGAGTGIGEAAAQIFSKNGFHCFLLGRRLDILINLKIENFKAIQCDLRDSKSIEAASKLLPNSIDCLVNNAGIIERKKFVDVSEESILEQFNTNIFGAMKITQRIIPMLSQNSSIINVSSNLGLRPIRETSVYSATKAAMINWTESLALELAPKTRVNCVCPGLVNTPIHKEGQKNIEKMRELIPLKRVGEPQDIAEAIFFLSNASWATGTILKIDGGL